MRKTLLTIYCIIFALILMVPSVGIVFFGAAEEESADVAQKPALRTEVGELNTNYFSLWGEYFEDHCALRSEMVTGVSYITSGIFGTSSQSGVIDGTDGWLYYADTLGDWQRSNIMSERTLFAGAHSLAMLQEYLNTRGVDFLFAIAPNKNTLYPDNMPYYYVQGEGATNRELLIPYLKSEGVNYIDLTAILSGAISLAGTGDVLYHQTDSHWTNEGATLACSAMLITLDVPHYAYYGTDYETRRDLEGDLSAMLFPAYPVLEDEIYYTAGPVYEYKTEVENNFAYRIETYGSGDGSLLMYRDSFGNSLLPFMAESFGYSLFSRSTALQISDIEAASPSVVVIEKVERFLSQLATYPPRIPADATALPEGSTEVTVSDTAIASSGTYTTITGTLPADSVNPDSLIYVCINGTLCYEAFPVSTGTSEGFSLCVEGDYPADTVVQIFVK